MKITLILIATFLCGPLSGFTGSETDSLFNNQIKKGELLDPAMVEASGLAVSRANPGYLWVHNDSGDQPRLFLVNPAGELKLTVVLNGAQNIDWEDIASHTIDGKDYLFIGDIGDNKAVRDHLKIYRLEEPKWDGSTGQIKVNNFDFMTFSYKEGPRDAETLMIDPTSKELVILSKRDPKALLYQFPFTPGSKIIISKKGELEITGFTAGDINHKGDVLLKDYNNIYYFESKGDTTTSLLLNGKFKKIPYQPEPQGESIVWNLDCTGFFTVSEKRFSHSRQFIFYFTN